MKLIFTKDTDRAKCTYFSENIPTLKCRVKSFYFKKCSFILENENNEICRVLCKEKIIKYCVSRIFDNCLGIRFEILKGNKKIGKINVKRNRKICCYTGDNKYTIAYEGKCYFSLKKNDTQFAVSRLNNYAKNGKNKYIVLYEENSDNITELLFLLLSLNDYLFFTDMFHKGSDTFYISFKKYRSNEICWRPADKAEISYDDIEEMWRNEDKAIIKNNIIIIIFEVLIVVIGLFMFNILNAGI